MYVRVRYNGEEIIVPVESQLTKIAKFRRDLETKCKREWRFQRLLYGGKLLEDGLTFYDYNIKLNDVIQAFGVKSNETSPTNVGKDTKNDKISVKPEAIKEQIKIEYKDAESTLYAVEDLIDMKDKEFGAWFEGKIVRIIHDPDAPSSIDCSTEMEEIENNNLETTDKSNTKEKCKVDNSKNKPLKVRNEQYSKSNKGIMQYFHVSPKTQKKKEESRNIQSRDEDLLYEVQLQGEEENSNTFCKLSEIRPRARRVIDTNDLRVGMMVMVNYNVEEPLETGYWYDFKINEIEKHRTNYKLIGTVYLGPEAVPQNDTIITVRDKIYAIEDPVPLSQRTDEYKKIIKTPPETRSAPLNCLTCRDDERVRCKECGCSICAGKQFPDKIVLCDECNLGFHLDCLSPPLTEIPDDDWYCPSCKRDPNEVAAPGAAKQTKRATKSKKDWGRGMACVGKTKTCVMPANLFGPIPGIEVGMCWRFRIQLSESGVHRPPVSGIHGRDEEGAYSIVLSGGYEDDVDHGYEFTYTGSGGRDLSGNKRTAQQSCDQTLDRENRALARNCAVDVVSKKGGDAGDRWREGRPVRVVRSYKMLKHFPKYAPKEGIRYDGIYKVVKYYPEKGLSGFLMWKYLLRRDDPVPAPWEEGAKQFTPIYPDGYLEAEAEKKAMKEKAREEAKNKKPLKKKASPRHDDTTSSESESEEPTPKKRVPVKKAPQKKRCLSSDSEGEVKPTPKRRKATKTPVKKSPVESVKATSKGRKGIKSPSKDSEGEVKPTPKGRKSVKTPVKDSESEVKTPPKEFKGIKSQVKDSEGESKPTPKGRKSVKTPAKPKGKQSGKGKKQTLISDIFNKSLEESSPESVNTLLDDDILEAIKADTINEKLWEECLNICKEKGKQQLIQQVTETFLCIICQEMVAAPTTTPCKHNFCLSCLKNAFKVTGSRSCPCCRNDLSKYTPVINELLRTALRRILPGYDAARH